MDSTNSKTKTKTDVCLSILRVVDGICGSFSLIVRFFCDSCLIKVSLIFFNFNARLL